MFSRFKKSKISFYLISNILSNASSVAKGLPTILFEINCFEKPLRFLAMRDLFEKACLSLCGLLFHFGCFQGKMRVLGLKVIFWLFLHCATFMRELLIVPYTLQRKQFCQKVPFKVGVRICSLSMFCIFSEWIIVFRFLIAPLFR